MENESNYYVCSICGKPAGKIDPKLRGKPRISHMECAEKETEEIRDRVRKVKMKNSILEQKKK